jgi:hypothetical protein
VLTGSSRSQETLTKIPLHLLQSNVGGWAALKQHIVLLLLSIVQFLGLTELGCSRYSNSLRAGQTGDEITMGATFSAPVQTCAGAHKVSYTLDTGSLSRERRGKRLWHYVGHQPLSSAEVKERV